MVVVFAPVKEIHMALSNKHINSGCLNTVDEWVCIMMLAPLLIKETKRGEKFYMKKGHLGKGK